jgi:hypothetical protein
MAEVTWRTSRVIAGIPMRTAAMRAVRNLRRGRGAMGGGNGSGPPPRGPLPKFVTSVMVLLAVEVENLTPVASPPFHWWGISPILEIRSYDHWL